MTHDLYHEVLLEEARRPKNQGEMPEADVTVQEMNASCGDVVRIFVSFDESKERIASVQWVGNGCIISQAALSVLSEFAKGKSRAEVARLEQQDLEELLGLEKMSPGRVKCLLLGLQGLQKACEQS